MKFGFYSASFALMQNRMFTNANVSSGAGDDLLLPFVKLAQQAEQRGIECLTVDTSTIESFDAFVFCEMPSSKDSFFLAAKDTKKPLYAILCENHFICRGNADTSRFSDFERVFTYNDDFVDGKAVIKLNYAFDLPKEVLIRPLSKKKLSVMICSNHKRDLRHLVYAKRRETINWFQDNNPEDFDLFGLGWEAGTLAFQTNPELQRLLRKFGLLRLFPRRKYSSWRGRVERKRDVLGDYRFGFCYENTTEIPGYITEKIFDVMMAGTVPVYLGPENAARHIPKGCFVDRRDFPDHAKLYAYLTNMPEACYRGYLEAIRDFLCGTKSYPFSINCFIETLLSNIQKKGANVGN